MVVSILEVSLFLKLLFTKCWRAGSSHSKWFIWALIHERLNLQCLGERSQCWSVKNTQKSSWLQREGSSPSVYAVGKLFGNWASCEHWKAFAPPSKMRTNPPPPLSPFSPDCAISCLKWKYSVSDWSESLISEAEKGGGRVAGTMNDESYALLFLNTFPVIRMLAYALAVSRMLFAWVLITAKMLEAHIEVMRTVWNHHTDHSTRTHLRGICSIFVKI
jgi:hypothetical protein